MGPFKGRPVGVSYGKSSMFILVEEVDGIPQAGAVYLPLTFDSGAMRARFNHSDGQLYVTGLRGWQTNGAHEGLFSGYVSTGVPVYLPISVHVHPDGIVIDSIRPPPPPPPPPPLTRLQQRKLTIMQSNGGITAEGILWIKGLEEPDPGSARGMIRSPFAQRRHARSESQ